MKRGEKRGKEEKKIKKERKKEEKKKDKILKKQEEKKAEKEEKEKLDRTKEEEEYKKGKIIILIGLKKRKIIKALKIIPKKIAILNLFISLLLSLIILFYSKNWITSIISFFVISVLLFLYIFARIKLKESTKIKKMESVFPDFLQLMASNLRAGMTTDRALLLSARKEFDPLDKEIIKLGKDIITGRKIEDALLDMAQRINSEKIHKTIRLIVSAIKSGGNMSVLLEETAVNVRERNFIEKRAASNVLMYVIFIFFATAIGAPALFGLSSVLVEVLTNILSTIPVVETTTTTTNLPFTLTKVSVSTTFITYFSLIFIITIDILGSLVLGLISKGDEKAGVKYIIPLISIGIFTFFIIRIVLLNYFSGVF